MYGSLPVRRIAGGGTEFRRDEARSRVDIRPQRSNDYRIRLGVSQHRDENRNCVVTLKATQRVFSTALMLWWQLRREHQHQRLDSSGIAQASKGEDGLLPYIAGVNSRRNCGCECCSIANTLKFNYRISPPFRVL